MFLTSYSGLLYLKVITEESLQHHYQNVIENVGTLDLYKLTENEVELFYLMKLKEIKRDSNPDWVDFKSPQSRDLGIFLIQQINSVLTLTGGYQGLSSFLVDLQYLRNQFKSSTTLNVQQLSDKVAKLSKELQDS